MIWAAQVTLKNSTTEYGLVSLLLHWVSALLVLGLFGVGLYMVDLTYYDPLYHELPEWHKTVGSALALLTLGRLLWHRISKPPSLLISQPVMRKAARVGHACLLILLLVLPLTGYLIVTAEGKPMLLFGLALLPALMELTPEQTDNVGQLHLWSAWALIGLAVGHSGAALKHHFVDRDRTMIRMLSIKSK